MIETLVTATFWIALLKIIWVNILLSGDNAVVIALASRNLPPKQQKKAIFFGSLAAIVLRVILTIFAIQLLQLPYLKLVGAVLLIWIGIQLLAGDDGDADIKSHSNLFAAIRTILIADLVMSLDNVIAVAAAAESGPPEAKILLLVVGLGLSIPLIIFGSQLILKLMDRYPYIITIGAALLGFVAGEMAMTDPAVLEKIGPHGHEIDYGVAAVCAIAVIVVGTWLGKRSSPSAQ